MKTGKELIMVFKKEQQKVKEQNSEKKEQKLDIASKCVCVCVYTSCFGLMHSRVMAVQSMSTTVYCHSYSLMASHVQNS